MQWLLYTGNATYLRHITKEEGLVVIPKTRMFSGVRAESLKRWIHPHQFLYFSLFYGY